MKKISAPRSARWINQTVTFAASPMTQTANRIKARTKSMHPLIAGTLIMHCRVDYPGRSGRAWAQQPLSA
jgi:hypothetical protein